MIYSEEEINQIRLEISELIPRWANAQSAYLGWKLTDDRAREYLTHGFARRLGTIVRCIENTFDICPLDQSEKLSSDAQTDLQIQLQAHVFNVFGCLDNLAWVWVSEKGITKEGKAPLPKDISLQVKWLKTTLPPNVQKYLDDHTAWLNESATWRHALAHRIPIYVPPYRLTPEDTPRWNRLTAEMWQCINEGRLDESERLQLERDDLGEFLPIMMHSYSEKGSPVGFHIRMLFDFKMVVGLADQFSPSF